MSGAAGVGWALGGWDQGALPQRTPALDRSRALMSVPSASGGQIPITGNLPRRPRGSASARECGAVLRPPSRVSSERAAGGPATVGRAPNRAGICRPPRVPLHGGDLSPRARVPAQQLVGPVLGLQQGAVRGPVHVEDRRAVPDAARVPLVAAGLGGPWGDGSVPGRPADGSLGSVQGGRPQLPPPPAAAAAAGRTVL